MQDDFVTPQGLDLSLFKDGSEEQLLTGIQRGIEKEGLRVDQKGQLSMLPHPRKLGSALTNPWLTTDFSEALLEFITPVFTSINENINYLKDIHALTLNNLDEENIWAGSMPCYLPEDEQIPVAQYGDSNIARMKTIYRIGLGNRYGRAMQTVAAIHYNFSMPENYWQRAFDNAKQQGTTIEDTLQNYTSQCYLDLIRNFRRSYWLLIYLFGAAPSFHESFVRGRESNMDRLGEEDLYLPYATSLRMGDLGYQSVAQQSLFVCYNELETYIDTLGEAIHVPFKDYEKIGVLVNGEYQQLNTSLLQIENEFYSPIRPKRVTNRGETPLHALDERGIEYVEVRCLDINPFLEVGIDEQTTKFLDIFLLHCLFKESAMCDEEEFKRIAINQSRIVNQGRDPDVKVYCDKTEVPMRKCARGLLDDMVAIAELLDKAHGGTGYMESLKLQKEKIENENLTPSGKILQIMEEENLSHTMFTHKQTRQFAKTLSDRQLDPELESELLTSAKNSFDQQLALENDTSMNFEEFLFAYYNQKN